MSKIKAALVTLMLGSSTAAMASPSVTFSADANLSWGTSSAPIVRDHRNQPAPLRPAPVRMSWISLGEPLSMFRGRDVIRPQLGTYSQIRLQAATGTTYVQKVMVRFTDGTMQTVSFNQYLGSWNPMVQFELEGWHRGIDSITVLGSSATRRGSYQVFAQGSRTIQLPHPISEQPTYERPQLPAFQAPAYDHPFLPPPVVNRSPVTLSELHFAGTQGFRVVYANANMGTFSTLRLQGLMAATPITKVEVIFANGLTQNIALNRTITPGEVVDLRLDARGMGQLGQIYLYTNDTLTPVRNAITSEIAVLAL